VWLEAVDDGGAEVSNFSNKRLIEHDHHEDRMLFPGDSQNLSHGKISTMVSLHMQISAVKEKSILGLLDVSS
jgi:hypothetical protein